MTRSTRTLFRLTQTSLLLLLSTTLSAEPRLRWETMELSASGQTREYQVGYLTVPENRRAESSRSIEVAFVRLPSTAEKPGPPIVYLNGGPGQPSTPALRSDVWTAAFNALRSVGDVILLDQRGTGLSRPALDCPDRSRSAAGAYEDGDEALHARLELLRQCAAHLRKSGADLDGYDTRESADDLNDLRIALGAEKLDLIGFSYGTHLGLAAIRQHGEHLNRVVLVGTEGPDHTWKLPSTLDMQFRKIAVRAGEDPDDLVTALERVLRQAEKQPYNVTIEGPGGKTETLRIGSRAIRQFLIWDLGDSRDFEWIPQLVRELDAGESAILAQLAQRRLGRVTRFDNLMGPLMDCASSVSDLRRARIEEEAGSSLFHNIMNLEEDRFCAPLGTRPLDDDFRSPIHSAVPTLFVSGTMDSNTPPFQAEEVRWGFTSADHIVVEGAGHEDLLSNRQTFAQIVRFLATGDIN